MQMPDRAFGFKQKIPPPSLESRNDIEKDFIIMLTKYVSAEKREKFTDLLQKKLNENNSEFPVLFRRLQSLLVKRKSFESQKKTTELENNLFDIDSVVMQMGDDIYEILSAGLNKALSKKKSIWTRSS
jgi:hypothetical protein